MTGSEVAGFAGVVLSVLPQVGEGPATIGSSVLAAEEVSSLGAVAHTKLRRARLVDSGLHIGVEYWDIIIGMENYTRQNNHAAADQDRRGGREQSPYSPGCHRAREPAH